jgi:inorganic pyrophosphatase
MGVNATTSDDLTLKLDTWSSPAAIAAPGAIAGALCLVFIVYLRRTLLKKPIGKDIDVPILDKLGSQVRSGSKAFLTIEYKYLTAFVLVLACVLAGLFSANKIDETSKDGGDTDGVRVAGAFLAGAFLSALAGWFGMSIATEGNVRTAVACASGTMNDGLRTAYTAGSVMGFTVVGLGLGGLSLMFWVQSIDRSPAVVMEILAGFGVGASSIALFARVAGGIYTKAADVGADLVGKVEAGIDEDDPHNPAVIADNVGDNVGDVAGMGADLFESYVGSIIAAGTLASNTADPRLLPFPFLLASVGVFCSFFGYKAVGTKEEGKGWNVNLGKLMWALEKGTLVADVLFLALAAVLTWMMFGDETIGWKLFGCIIIGLFSGVAIGKWTEYFTSFDVGPVLSIKDRGATGPATVVIQGIGVGMISCAPPTVILCACILACANLSPVGNEAYGVSIAAVGMLATLGNTLATDAYGPVADNAGGLVEMAGLDKSVRDKTDSLDALGNTTAATGKGFAIGSAVLTALSLLAAFRQKVSKDTVMTFDISDATVMSGALFGAMLPYLFGALTMISVGKAAAGIIDEVRRQFREIKGLRDIIERASRGEKIPAEEDVEPDSDRCVALCTASSVEEMLAPGGYAMLAPIFVGFCVGPKCLMGMLAGSIVSGSMLAIMMSNAGGAWDNSKKLCEKLQIKKSEQGKACIIGDTVGDPFKDTSGPALNILIKLMSMVSLLIAPLIKGKETWDDWYLGMIPLALFIILSLVLVYKGILTWKDPLAELQAKDSIADVTVSDEKKPVEQGDAKSDSVPEEVGPVLMQSSMDARPMDEKPVQEVDAKNESTEEKPLQQDAENDCVAEV